MIDTQATVERATQNFLAGYNCAQSVALAFADHYHLPHDLLAQLAAPFGAGIGRMRETCGTASAIFMLSGLENANTVPDQEAKRRTYEHVQRLAADFKQHTGGTIICRELLQGHAGRVTTDPQPEARTPEYYKKRPCVRMVQLATQLYCDYLNSQADTSV